MLRINKHPIQNFSYSVTIINIMFSSIISMCQDLKVIANNIFKKIYGVDID